MQIRNKYRNVKQHNCSESFFQIKSSWHAVCIHFLSHWNGESQWLSTYSLNALQIIHLQVTSIKKCCKRFLLFAIEIFPSQFFFAFHFKLQNRMEFFYLHLVQSHKSIHNISFNFFVLIIAELRTLCEWVNTHSTLRTDENKKSHHKALPHFAIEFRCDKPNCLRRMFDCAKFKCYIIFWISLANEIFQQMNFHSIHFFLFLIVWKIYFR
jgi:hypothetical protein